MDHEASDIAPDKLLPLESVDDPHAYLRDAILSTDRSKEWIAAIVASMEDDDWVGRPLLVHESEGGRYQAWGGMHRLEAARRAGLATVPAVIMSKEELVAVGFSEEALRADPWQQDYRLRNLHDPRPWKLRQLEHRLQPERGF